jgi:hypothetical protein
MHLLSRCSGNAPCSALGPGPGSFRSFCPGPPQSPIPKPQAQVQARSHRIWELVPCGTAYCVAFRGAGGTQEGSGCTYGGGFFYFYFRRGRQKKICEGNAITFLVLGPGTGVFGPPPPHAIYQPPTRTPYTDTGAESQGALIPWTSRATTRAVRRPRKQKNV